MDVGLLYSGGKDSTLAGLLLDPVADVTCLVCSFGITDTAATARDAARAVGFDVEGVALEPDVAEEAVATIAADGFPRHGIQTVHEHALETAAELGYDAIADGTRRGDRAPTVDRAVAQHLEDTHDVSHVAPLAGMGRAAVDALADAHLSVATGESESLPTGDYEAELRALMAETHGRETVERVFPTHVQSRVRGRAPSPKS
jgi:predicted subunit of tRNA(5-methylaminomethyl-2-thiouridylate) methyltransferase